MKLAGAFSSRPPYGPVPPGVLVLLLVCTLQQAGGQSCRPRLRDDNWEPGIQGGGHTVPCIQQQRWLKHIPGWFIPLCALPGEREVCGECTLSVSSSTCLPSLAPAPVLSPSLIQLIVAPLTCPGQNYLPCPCKNTTRNLLLTSFCSAGWFAAQCLWAGRAAQVWRPCMADRGKARTS